jgi:capsular polysaccharide transport system permease protein
MAAMYLSNTETFDLWSAAKRQRRVLFALMLRNMRTKFFGNGLGYMLAVAWPLTHIIIIVAMFTVMGRVAPVGDSITLFVATGAVPFQTFNYLTRFMMTALVKSRPLLAFPEVKTLDMLFAAALLEILSAFTVVIAFLVIAWFAGVDAMPRDIVGAACALGAAVLVGLGFGLLNGIIGLAFPPWTIGYVLVQVIFWVTSGVLFVPDALPEPLREIVAWLPAVQVIEWMRSAYYEGYGGLVLDRTYIIGFAFVTIFLGLALERMMRGYVLAKRW